MSTNGSSWSINSGSLGTIPSNAWTYVSVVRNSGTVTLYVNGTSVYNSTLSSTAVLYSGTYNYIGAENYSSAGYRFYTGYIDDLRITNGIARYTTNFTPPATYLPNY